MSKNLEKAESVDRIWYHERTDTIHKESEK